MDVLIVKCRNMRVLRKIFKAVQEKDNGESGTKISNSGKLTLNGCSHSEMSQYERIEEEKDNG